MMLYVHYADEYSRDKGSFKDAVLGRAEITAKEKSGQTGVGTKSRDAACSVKT